MRNVVMCVLSFGLGIILMTTLSMSKKTEPVINNESSLESLNYSDTIIQNDSMFTVLTYKEGRLKKTQLFGYTDETQKYKFGINKVKYYEDGRIAFVSETCRSKKSDESVIYEEQKIYLDTNHRLSRYQLMDDFKIICRGN